MTFVRTVLGDIDPSELGVTYAHEHVVIDGGRPVLMEPDFDLGDVDAMTTEIGEATAKGLHAIVDAMPCDAGRSALKLAELSRRTGVHVIAPTGLHHDRYYGPAHWSARLRVEELATLFVLDVTDGIDLNDYSGPGRASGPRIGPGSSRWPAARAGRRSATGGSSRRRPSPISRPACRS